jgi:hypothetical protein
MPQVCIRCRVRRKNEEFINQSGKVLKSCNQCRHNGSAGGSNVHYYTEPQPKKTNNVQVEQEYYGDGDEGGDSDDDSSSEGFEAICEACEKTFYDQKSAEKHATTKAHIRKWNNVYGQGDDDDE